LTERIDVHVHVYEQEVADRALSNIRKFRAAHGIAGVEISEDGTPAHLLREMERLKIHRCVLQAVVRRPDAMRKINAWTAAAMKASGGRLLGFGGIHPLAAGDDIDDEIKRFRNEYGFPGIKLHPTLQGFDPMGPQARRLYDRAAREGLAVLIHPDHRTGRRFQRGTPDQALTHEKLCALIEEHPGLPIVAAHLGSRHSERLEAAVKANPTVWLDLAIVRIFYPEGPATVVDAIRRFGAERVLFGSDFPYWPQEAALSYFDKLNLTPEERRAIQVDNPRRFLRL
jgi:predicted TIM-barrel fold metal-dependent hydrolase